METFLKTILATDRDGLARFREEQVPLSEGTPKVTLSAVYPSAGYQLRRSPVGFRSDWHCTTTPQWVIILQGEIEVGVRDGSSRVFRPGMHFFASDTVPAGAAFDPLRHGHWSAQRGPDVLVTLFLRT
ncbi:MAG: hypothetical protein ACREVQ_02575 [Burkholderiales bacterium]